MSATITYTVTTNDDVFQLDVDGEMVDYQRAVLDYGDDIVVTYPASDSIDDLAAALREAGYTPVDAGCERVKMGLYEVPGYRPGTPYGYVIAVAN